MSGSRIVAGVPVVSGSRIVAGVPVVYRNVIVAGVSVVSGSSAACPVHMIEKRFRESQEDEPLSI